MLRFFRNYYLPLIAALLLSLSRLPLYLGWLVFIAFVPLLSYFEIKQRSVKEDIISALIFSLVQIALVYYWIALVTWGGLIGIWLIFALYYFVCFRILQRIWYRLPCLRMPAFLSIFISFEFLQNFSEMRFPWWNIGYSLTDYLPLLQALELGGMSLLALLILSLNYLFYTLTHQNYRAWIAIVLIFGSWYAFGRYRLRSLPMHKEANPVAVMQPSIEQDEKWDDAEYQKIMKRYDQLCAQAADEGQQMLIFPEAAIPDYLMIKEHIREDLQQLIRKHQIAIFAGFPHAEKATALHPLPFYFYNAATLFSTDGRHHDLYFKNILVPVGERMLWLEHFPLLWNLEFGQANWEFGTQIPRYEFGGKEFSPSICYELAFPHFYQRANFSSSQGEFRKADYHVNITNDAWFGTSYGPWLHAVMTRFRAIESRLQFYRSANTGISMIVDPKGQVLASTELFDITNISADLYTSSVIPLYSRIYKYPWIFVGITTLFFVLSFLFTRRLP
jgi:apolipoprotein N-acyltransferase